MMIKLNPAPTSELAGIVASGAFFRATDYRSPRSQTSKLNGAFLMIWACVAVILALLSKPWESELAYSYQISYLVIVPFFVALFLYPPMILVRKFFRSALRS